MNRICNLGIALLVFFVIKGCKGYDSFYRDSQLSAVMESSYEDKPLEIQNYILCSSRREMTLGKIEFENFKINNDSVANLFISKIKSLDLKLELSELVDKSIDSFCHNEFIKIKDLKKVDFENLGINSKGKRILLPIIQIDEIFRFTGYITSK